jgi:hypothetical protein
MRDAADIETNHQSKVFETLAAGAVVLTPTE